VLAPRRSAVSTGHRKAAHLPAAVPASFDGGGHREGLRVEDITAIVCPETGVTAHEAASRALVARDHLDGEVTASPNTPLAVRRRAMIEDVRVLTGLLAAELSARADDPAPWIRASHRADEAHRAALRSDDFAFLVALAMRALDRDPRAE
jgi:hypothetical protein